MNENCHKQLSDFFDVISKNISNEKEMFKSKHVKDYDVSTVDLALFMIIILSDNIHIETKWNGRTDKWKKTKKICIQLKKLH